MFFLKTVTMETYNSIFPFLIIKVTGSLMHANDKHTFCKSEWFKKNYFLVSIQLIICFQLSETKKAQLSGTMKACHRYGPLESGNRNSHGPMPEHMNQGAHVFMSTCFEGFSLRS